MKKITYLGMTLGNIFGWYFPKIVTFLSDDIFTKLISSMFFGIFGIYLGYKINQKFFK